MGFWSTLLGAKEKAKVDSSSSNFDYKVVYTGLGESEAEGLANFLIDNFIIALTNRDPVGYYVSVPSEDFEKARALSKQFMGA